jgi:lantibiotic modifying enzyme
VIARNILDPAAAAAVLDCDYIFLAADEMRARLLVNAMVHQYLIPGAQIGSKVSVDDAGQLTDVFSVVRPLRPGLNCLWCNQLINCQWCYGAPGIGLARIATQRHGVLDSNRLMTDIEAAVTGIEKGAQRHLDTLCCGTLGVTEFLCEAGSMLERHDLRDRASRKLAAVIETAASVGDYRWNAGTRRFNLGLFRGLAGIGYTTLRRVEQSLPNVLVWE